MKLMLTSTNINIEGNQGNLEEDYAKIVGLPKSGNQIFKLISLISL